MTKRELLQRAINELAKRDPTRYFSIAEIAAQAGTLHKETQAWLAVLRLNNKVVSVIKKGQHWYAPRED